MRVLELHQGGEGGVCLFLMLIGYQQLMDHGLSLVTLIQIKLILTVDLTGVSQPVCCLLLLSAFYVGAQVQNTSTLRLKRIHGTYHPC